MIYFIVTCPPLDTHPDPAITKEGRDQIFNLSKLEEIRRACDFRLGTGRRHDFTFDVLTCNRTDSEKACSVVYCPALGTGDMMMGDYVLLANGRAVRSDEYQSYTSVSGFHPWRWSDDLEDNGVVVITDVGFVQALNYPDPRPAQLYRVDTGAQRVTLVSSTNLRLVG